MKLFRPKYPSGVQPGDGVATSIPPAGRPYAVATSLTSNWTIHSGGSGNDMFYSQHDGSDALSNFSDSDDLTYIGIGIGANGNVSMRSVNSQGTFGDITQLATPMFNLFIISIPMKGIVRPTTATSSRRTFRLHGKYSGAISNGASIRWYAAKGLTSHIPIATVSASDTINTTLSVDIPKPTSLNGLIFAIAANDIETAQNCVWTGDEIVEVLESTSAGIKYSIATDLNTDDNAANTITSTWDVISTTNVGLLAAYFR